MILALVLAYIRRMRSTFPLSERSMLMLMADCQNLSKPFRPELDWSKWCLNLVYLRNNLKFRQGGGTWILNFRPSKYLDIHLKHRVPRPFSTKAIKNPSRVAVDYCIQRPSAQCQTHTASYLTLIQIVRWPAQQTMAGAEGVPRTTRTKS